MYSFIASKFGDAFMDNLLKTLRSEIFIVLLVIAVGYFLGRISIKGVSFGSSGVFIIALVVGILLKEGANDLGLVWITERAARQSEGITMPLTTIQNIGLVMFITSIGFISGPTFIRNFKKKAGSFITMSIAVNVVAVVLCAAIVWIDSSLDAAKGTGILMGALSSTPGLASAKDFFLEQKDTVSALSGLAYPFGVLGVVLFVQLMPKILRKDMATEVEKLRAGIEANKSVNQTVVSVNPDMVEVKPRKKNIMIDPMGISNFTLAAGLGMLLGSLTLMMGASAKFSLGMTGGALIMGLIFGHFKHVGRISLEVPEKNLKAIREIGLVLFLASTGIEGGLNFLNSFKWIYLLYGAILTIAPMVVGFVVGKLLFKIELLNNLGTICGGMTSTPALGSLIQVSGTEDVAHSYAAAYPISLFFLVFVPQIISFIT